MAKRVKKVKLVCPICEKEYERYPSSLTKTCSKECKYKKQSEDLKGENNPNFGNKWTDEQKKNQSENHKKQGHLISERVKKDWENNTERREAMSKMMSEIKKGQTNWLGRTHSDESKEKIGKKSKAKFTDEFKEKFRKTMEDLGHWIPLEEKNDWEIYSNESDWIDAMFDIIDEGNDLLEEFGVFNAYSNKTGVVRDHIFGRRAGFKFKLFPEILRHPANCRILLHAENARKGQKTSDIVDSDITIEELFQRIRDYSKEWKEHEKVLILIEDYMNGSRWKNIYKGGYSDG